MNDYVMDRRHPGTAMARGVQGVIGKGLDRYEARLKVSGTATFGYEHAFENVAYGYLITAPFAAGRVTNIDDTRSRGMPGVLDILMDDQHIAQQAALLKPAPRGNKSVDHYDQVLGAVIAESFEEARDAALAVIAAFQPREGRFDKLAALDRATPPPKDAVLQDIVIGDIDAAMAAGAVTLDRKYSTPNMVHAAMEPHASIAMWEGDKLTLYSSLQILGVAREVLASALDIDATHIRIVSPHVGGGFGGKLLGPEAVAAAIAARRLSRPVKIAMSRSQLFHNIYRRTDTHQRIRLAAGTDGRLTAIGQDSVLSQSPSGGLMEPVALGTMGLYAAPARHFTHRVVELDLVSAASVRAPGEAVGMLVLETAMDEMAELLSLDPVTFRKLNEPDTDPTTSKPFSTRALIECFDKGTEAFGWARRVATPSAIREGEWLIGMGVATTVRINLMKPSEARVTLDALGHAHVATDMTDIGTGSYTILAQIAAESLGLPFKSVTVSLGDSDQPTAAGSGGSAGASSSGSSVALACDEIVAELARRMDVAPEGMTLRDGHAIAGNRRVPLTGLIDGQPIIANGKIGPGKNNEAFSQAAYGAQFAEVAVNAVTGETRVRRMLGVFDAGRILNAKTARSQAIGGTIWGIGYALMEGCELDVRFGNFVNHDLAEYHIPTHADVPAIDVIFVEHIDEEANPIGIKGLGELSISGAGAAVANAIYNACGVRVRDFPVTLDKILAGWPPT